MQSQIHLKEEKGFIRDPILDTAFQDLEDLRDKLQQAQEKLFNVGVYLTVYADNEEELNQTETEIKSILESKLVYVKPSLFQQKEGLETVFPLGTDKLDVSTQLNSSPISSLFPFVSFDLSSDKGILYGINRHNNSLVLFDRFSLENYNSVIFAKAGSGKSYATKLEVLRSLMFDTEVIIIDPEREYEYLAEATGGRYFNISLNSIHHINPFDLPPVREDESPADVLRSNIIALVGLFRLMLGGLSTEEDSIMDRAITETYASKDITPETDFTGATPPTLSDLELVLAGMEGGESLAQRMAKYTKGHLVGLYQSADQCGHKQKNGGFFHQGYGRRIEADRDVSHHSLYLEYHPKGHKKRLLVIDEAWWMMKYEDTASFLYGIAKRCRKYYLGLATITQDVGDFLASPYGIPIITNSSIQLLLKQSPATIDIVQKTFNLTDEEKYLLLESDVGEGIFFAGLKHVAIKILASYTEDQIITSDPAQLMAIKKAKEEYNLAQQ